MPGLDRFVELVPSVWIQLKKQVHQDIHATCVWRGQEQIAAGCQDPADLGDRPCRIPKQMLEHLGEDHIGGRVRLERKPFGLDVDARDRVGTERNVDRDRVELAGRVQLPQEVRDERLV